MSISLDDLRKRRQKALERLNGAMNELERYAQRARDGGVSVLDRETNRQRFWYAGDEARSAVLELLALDDMVADIPID